MPRICHSRDLCAARRKAGIQRIGSQGGIVTFPRSHAPAWEYIKKHASYHFNRINFFTALKSSASKAQKYIPLAIPVASHTA